MRLGVLGVVAALIGVQAGVAQQAAAPFTLVASYDREGLPVPQWTIHIAPDASVDYTSHHAAPGVADVPVRFMLSSTGQAKLGRWLADSRDLSPCETKSKGLARMGMKTLTYTPSTGVSVTCAYNFSDNKPMMQAMEYLTQTSATIETGMTIDRLHRYDRLGLDPVLMRLAADAKEGKAQELAAIRSALESLVTDDAVLERVRLRAAQLLELAKLQ